MTEICSDDLLEELDISFRVSAGPGAGKTYWLVNHIKAVVAKGKSLGKCGRIACITYTNIAAETVTSRLGDACHKTDVATIHAFFYKNVIRPYLSFVAEEFSVATDQIDGHEESVISEYKFIEEWKRQTNQTKLFNHATIIAGLSDISWEIGPTGEASPYFKTQKGKASWIRKDSLWTYKKMAWARGVLHHDDVLYFTHLLFSRHPHLCNVVVSRFPYFFIDEFQDSTPLQIAIFKLLGNAGAHIGIIGDAAQSIYGFTGANPLDFSKFALHNLQDFVIKQNRRSSNEIIDALNYIRPNFPQKAIRNQQHGLPILLIGNVQNALTFTEKKFGNQKVAILARKNETVCALKSATTNPATEILPVTDAISEDSNWIRREVLMSCVRAVEHARQTNFSQGLNELERGLKKLCGQEFAEKNKVRILLHLHERATEFWNKPMTFFADYLDKKLNLKVSTISFGKPKLYYDKNSFCDLATATLISPDLGMHRTVHKSKGDEFENVLLVLDEKEAVAITKPEIDKKEAHRIVYVGMSRAKNNLLISIPSLDARSTKKLKKIFDIVSLS